MTSSLKRKRKASEWKDPRLEGMDIRYGGRTLQLTVYVNTERELGALVEAVKVAARGPRLDMVTILGGEVESSKTTELWETVMGTAERAVSKQGLS